GPVVSSVTTARLPASMTCTLPAPRGGGDQALVLGAQHAARLWTAWNRAGVDKRFGVDDFDSSMGGVSDEAALAGPVDVDVVEAAVAKWGKADEADRRQGHA